MAKKSEASRHGFRIPDVLLNVEDISIVFGGLRAVSNFSCRLKKGELVGLIGPNGAGKTTVFNMLSGVYTPTEGEILFTDKNGRTVQVHNRKPHQLAKLGIARTFQNIRLFAAMSVLDNVKVGHHLRLKSSFLSAGLGLPSYGREEQTIHAKSVELLKTTGLEDVAFEQAGSLPYGKQRRVEIARALATNPKLLLLDEPAAGMNPEETQSLMDFILKILKDFDLTIFLIEHQMRLVMGICQRILVLNYGITIAQGLPEEIQSNPAVIEAYLGVSANVSD